MAAHITHRQPRCFVYQCMCPKLQDTEVETMRLPLVVLSHYGPGSGLVDPPAMAVQVRSPTAAGHVVQETDRMRPQFDASASPHLFRGVGRHPCRQLINSLWCTATSGFPTCGCRRHPCPLGVSSFPLLRLRDVAVGDSFSRTCRSEPEGHHDPGNEDSFCGQAPAPPPKGAQCANREKPRPQHAEGRRAMNVELRYGSG